MTEAGEDAPTDAPPADAPPLETGTDAGPKDAADAG